MLNLSKNKIKLIKSLAGKKNRIAEGLFLAEGNKLVKEIISSGYLIETLVITREFADELTSPAPAEVIVVSRDELNRASLLKNPQQALAVVRIPQQYHKTIIHNNLVLCLDDIQDPGNLGTIVRLADWFGISQIVCSENTVDIYNPKAIQATMGSIVRVSVSYSGLNQFFRDAMSMGIKIYGAATEGTNIYKALLPSEAVVVLGNEGKGIHPEFTQYFHQKLSIPNLSASHSRTESLNVSMATAIICSEFRRRFQ